MKMHTSGKTKVIIVDDNTSFRNAFRKLLESEYNCSVLAEAENGEQYLDLRNRYLADVVFMDLFMPGKNGKDITNDALEEQPGMKFIAVTMHADEAYTRELIKIGFRGVIAKPRLFEELPEALDTVLSGLYYFPEYVKI